MDADGLALPDDELPAGLDVGLAESLACAAGPADATLGEDAALVAAAAGGAGEAALVAAGAADAAGAGVVAGADDPTEAEEVIAGVAEWLFAVQAAVTRIGTAIKTAITRPRCGRGVIGTGVILPDRLPV